HGPPSNALCFDVGRNALRLLRPARLAGTVGPDLLDFPRSRLCARLWARKRVATGRSKPTHKENAADDASRYILRLRSPRSISVTVGVPLPRLWQDGDHEGLDPRRGLRRRED